MKNIWDKWSNAKHIDSVFRQLILDQEAWTQDHPDTDKSRMALDRAIELSAKIGRSLARVHYPSSHLLGGDSVVSAALVALIIYDEAGPMLESDPEQIRLLGLIGSDPAILIYPAIKLLQEEKVHDHV